MDKNLKIIDYIIEFEEAGSPRLVKIQAIYIRHNFTKKQKKACELFLFEPNKKNALRAIEITPKAWLFLKKFSAIHPDIVQTIDSVLVSTRKKSYLKEVISYQNSFLDLLELLQKISSNRELVKQIKVIMMERKLSKSI